MKKLEVGMAFEVVEVLENGLQKTVGQQCINLGRIEDSPIYNNVYCDKNYHFLNFELGKATLLEDGEIKQVGRLIIKSVK